MSFVRIRCPYADCRKKIRTPLALSEKKAKCPACDRPMLVPKLKRQTVLSSLVLSPPAAIPVGKPAAPPPVVPIPVCGVALEPLPPPGPSPFDWNQSAFEPEPPTIQEPPTPSIWRTAVAAVLFGVLLGGAFMTWSWVRTRPTGEVAEARQQPRDRDEEIVARKILDAANDPRSVEFARWGPHWNDAEWPPAILNIKSRPARMLRVVYRANNAHGAKVLFDEAMLVQDGAVVTRSDNKFGDDWIEIVKAQRQFLVNKFNGK